jgi:light-regulated signal transduction histidine kinase (bacteriophytochrome)
MIASYSQLLVRRYSTSTEEAASWVKFISEGTTRMRDLLTDLLAYAELSSESENSLEPVDLNSVVQQVIENLRVAIDENKACVTAGELPVVPGESAHFLQLFQNLVGNALKYRGEVPPRIEISATRGEEGWRISVSDNGIGIDSKYHTRIFGVFMRLHGTSIPGTGIGLATCQRVVERYGGRIWVKSERDRGATFHFTIPVVDRQQ